MLRKRSFDSAQDDDREGIGASAYCHLNRIGGESPHPDSLSGEDLYQKAGLPLINAAVSAFLKIGINLFKPEILK